MQLGQQVVQAREVEHVAQDLAVGLEHDRELRVAARDLEQRLRLQPLLPQRRAAPRVGARDQQRAAGVLAEAGAEQRASRPARRRRGPRARRGRSASAPRPGASSASGRWTMMPSSDQIASDSSPYTSRMRADSASPQAACTRPPNGRQDAHPPVADLVPEALDHDRAVGRDDPRRLLLLAQELDAGCARPAGRGRSRRPASPRSCSTAQRAKAPIASPSSFGRPSPSPFQNGTAPGTPGAGVTITRSRVISSIRHDDAPSRKTWPARAS